MDTLSIDEIEAIWGRRKRTLDLSQITAVNRQDAAKQLDALLLSENIEGANPQANDKFLVEKGFSEAALKSANIREEVFAGRVREVRVSPEKTLFQIAKGAPTIKLPTGGVIRAGQFLRGKNREEAISSLLARFEDPFKEVKLPKSITD